MTVEGPRWNPDGGPIPPVPLRAERDDREVLWPNPPRSTMPDNPPTKATTIAATILCVGLALMLTLAVLAAIIWAL